MTDYEKFLIQAPRLCQDCLFYRSCKCGEHGCGFLSDDCLRGDKLSEQRP